MLQSVLRARLLREQLSGSPHSLPTAFGLAGPANRHACFPRKKDELTGDETAFANPEFSIYQPQQPPIPSPQGHSTRLRFTAAKTIFIHLPHKYFSTTLSQQHNPQKWFNSSKLKTNTSSSRRSARRRTTTLRILVSASRRPHFLRFLDFTLLLVRHIFHWPISSPSLSRKETNEPVLGITHRLRNLHRVQLRPVRRDPGRASGRPA